MSYCNSNNSPDERGMSAGFPSPAAGSPSPNGASPLIIQGGMGAGVSDWRLARAVAAEGQLGVVSGTALDSVFIRRLQEGDHDGAMRRGLAAFPWPKIADRILDQYYIPGGKPADQPYLDPPSFTVTPSRELLQITAAANFTEVTLAKEGHDNPVGINLMEKVQMPNLASLYGAMLAGVDYVLMGAGIPLAIPGILDHFARGEGASLEIHTVGPRPETPLQMTFEPGDIFPDPPSRLQRPRFLAIISSNVLAETLVRKASGRVDGFVIEDSTAGGHNAPPRRKGVYSETGEPVYSAKDQVDPEKLCALGRPFWLAGSRGTWGMAERARSIGAAGIQVGSDFVCALESGFTREIKERILRMVQAGKERIFTDPHASPTGFPFKLLRMPGTASEEDVYRPRQRQCLLGYLRMPFVRGDGRVGYRCPAEPVQAYTAKGGQEEETRERRCLCSGLLANLGLGSPVKGGGKEPALITLGSSAEGIRQVLEAASEACRKRGESLYRAADVINLLLGKEVCP